MKAPTLATWVTVRQLAEWQQVPPRTMKRRLLGLRKADEKARRTCRWMARFTEGDGGTLYVAPDALRRAHPELFQCATPAPSENDVQELFRRYAILEQKDRAKTIVLRSLKQEVSAIKSFLVLD